MLTFTYLVHFYIVISQSLDAARSNFVIFSYYLAFQSVDFERHQMKVIPICRLWASSDEGYSSNAPCTL